MRKILALTLTIWLSVFISTTANADQRFESWQGLCHFAYDPADDDNEVYFSNCQNTIDTYNDGNGRLAYGQSNVIQEYNIADKTSPKELNYVFPTKLKGNATEDRYEGAVSNAPCVMVTSNYDANADANNETVYVSNDWNLVITPKLADVRSGDITYMFELSCRGGVAQ